MYLRKSPRRILILLGIGILNLDIATTNTLAQQVQKNTILDTSLGKATISGYQKISGSRTSLHFVGNATTMVLTAKNDSTLHRLHADDIEVRKEDHGVSAELSGNVHYTLQPSGNGNKLVEATAQRASYRSDPKNATNLILSRVHATLWHVGNAVRGVNRERDSRKSTGADGDSE